MRRSFGNVFLALTLLSGSAAAHQPFDPTRLYPKVAYRLSLEGGGLGYSIDETVVVTRFPLKSGGDAWVAERRRHEQRVSKPMNDQHQWIDGRACPALLQTFGKLADLPPVRFGTPDSLDESMMFDGATLTLLAPGSTESNTVMRLVRVSEAQGPYMRWWLDARAPLEPCWKTAAPLLDGAPAKSYLDTDEAAKRLKPHPG